ncbi:MAG: hypothetical protein E7090_07150 [Bacteroidales bacterium]|nr:hypothetical protein [Bacteroidales bacterium]
MKKLFTSIALVAVAMTTFAGGLLTNTNQSASFVRNPMRYASLETDAIYFNPAGSAFFNDGWSFSANWQMIWQDRDVFAGKNGQEFKGSVYVPCMPTLFAAYKTGKWTFSGFFGMPGGGGKAEFENGLPIFNNMVNGLYASGLAGVNPALAGVTGYNTTSTFTSTQYLFSLQLGAAYQINDNLSVYGGIRTNYTSLSYEGAIKTTFPNGAMYNTGSAEVPMSAIPALAPYEAAVLAAAPNYTLEMTQTGIAFAPIIGVDYKVGDFNFGVKYEFRAVNIIENDTDASTSDKLLENQPTLADGVKFRNDAPALLTLGASWDITSRLKVMGGYTYYFDKDAKIESLLTKANSMRTLSRNTFEILGGVEYKLTDKWLLSTGFQFSDFGVNPSYVSDISFINDSFTVGAGAKYSINEKWDLNFGACYANYAPGTSLSGSYYKRKTYNVAVGVDFRL